MEHNDSYSFFNYLNINLYILYILYIIYINIAGFFEKKRIILKND